jgi:hypothetical protein
MDPERELRELSEPSKVLILPPDVVETIVEDVQFCAEEYWNAIVDFRRDKSDFFHWDDDELGEFEFKLNSLSAKLLALRTIRSAV